MNAAGAVEAVTLPELEAALAEFERVLTERTTVLLWRLFGGIVAVVGLTVAALRYLS